MNREDLFYAIEEEASYQKLIDVLRAVVELHKPRNHAFNDLLWCENCFDGVTTDGQYPCATIKAIEKELA